MYFFNVPFNPYFYNPLLQPVMAQAIEGSPPVMAQAIEGSPVMARVIEELPEQARPVLQTYDSRVRQRYERIVLYMQECQQGRSVSQKLQYYDRGGTRRRYEITQISNPVEDTRTFVVYLKRHHNLCIYEASAADICIGCEEPIQLRKTEKDRSIEYRCKGQSAVWNQSNNVITGTIITNKFVIDEYVQFQYVGDDKSPVITFVKFTDLIRKMDL